MPSNEPAAAPLRAACSCGAVAVELTGEPAFEAICACTGCQSRTGSAFGVSAYYPKAQVIAFHGAPTVYRRVSERGKYLDFRFCGVCGTTVWWEGEFRAGDIGVAATLIDGRASQPSGAYFCSSKPDWALFDDAVPVAQRGAMSS